MGLIKYKYPIKLTTQNYLELFDENNISGQAEYSNNIQCKGNVLGNMPTYSKENDCFYSNTPEGKRFSPIYIINYVDIEESEYSKIIDEIKNKYGS